MSAYQNWFTTFPSRQSEIFSFLKRAKNGEVWRAKNVTILLMISGSGFVVPLERLDESRATDLGQENLNEARRIRREMGLDTPSFIRSVYVKDASAWKMGHLKSIAGEPDNWPIVKNQKALAPSFSVQHVLCDVMRNALAHGTVWATPALPNLLITDLLFVSRRNRHTPDEGFDFVSVSIPEFEAFLSTWLSQLEGANFSACRLAA